MTRRHPVAVVVLTLLTFTLYAYYWLYRTTDELRQASGKKELSPFTDVALAALTVGLWGLWAAYRNARIVHELLRSRGIAHTDRSLPIAALGGLTFFTGGAWLAGMALLQDDYNQVTVAVDPWAPAIPYETSKREPVRARVELDPAEDSLEEVPAAPRGEVFESNAPAPFAF